MDELLEKASGRSSETLYEEYSAYITLIGLFRDLMPYSYPSQYQPGSTYKMALFTLMLSDTRVSYGFERKRSYENTLTIRCRVTNQRLIETMETFSPNTIIFVHGRLANYYHRDNKRDDFESEKNQEGDGRKKEKLAEKNESGKENINREGETYNKPDVVLHVRDVGFSLKNRYIYNHIE
jgi:hypothetical protein